MGASMQTCSQVEIDALLHALEEAGPFVLASPDDADYFRKTFLKKAIPAPVVETPTLPPPAPIVKKIEPPKPLPAPVAIEEEKTIAPVFDASVLRHLLKSIAPELAILDEIPSDALAKKIAERWKTKNQSAPISVLSLNEEPKQKAILEEIAIALDVYFGGAKIVNAELIEKEKQWQAFLSVADLKMVVVCDYTLWQLTSLMQHYKETPATGTRVLGNTPVFLLPDLSLYLKDPLLKRSLWKALCQKFS